jgi:hypothetical protein
MGKLGRGVPQDGIEWPKSETECAFLKGREWCHIPRMLRGMQRSVMLPC